MQIGLNKVSALAEIETIGQFSYRLTIWNAAATQPGPFFAHTIELGRYLGIRDAGRLVAIAGERMLLDDYTEISAVCTAPSHQGRGVEASWNG